MTPDQLHQVVVELSGLAAAVFANGRWRKRTANGQCAVEIEQVDRIETEGKLMREDMRKTRDAMVRLEVRIEAGELADERVRVEMHALTGRVDASNALYSEILQKAKEAKERTAWAQAKIEPGNKVDVQDQTKTTVKKEEKK